MKTVGGRILVGWMDEAVAVDFLLNLCVFDPPIDDARARQIWRDYRARAQSLPARPPVSCGNLGLTIPEIAHANKFKKHLNSIGSNTVLDIAKVEIKQLYVIQYYVVIDKASEYAAKNKDSAMWLNECLPTCIPNSQFIWNQAYDISGATAFFDLPHAEFLYAGDQNAMFGLRELQRYVTVKDNGQRTYLTAGYHRMFARVLAAPMATVPKATVAVALNDLPCPPLVPNAPILTTPVADTFDPWGTKPALFADFFTDGLFMDVRLKKKRYQLQVSAKMVALDDN